MAIYGRESERERLFNELPGSSARRRALLCRRQPYWRRQACSADSNRRLLRPRSLSSVRAPTLQVATIYSAQPSTAWRLRCRGRRLCWAASAAAPTSSAGFVGGRGYLLRGLSRGVPARGSPQASGTSCASRACLYYCAMLSSAAPTAHAGRLDGWRGDVALCDARPQGLSNAAADWRGRPAPAGSEAQRRGGASSTLQML